MTTKISPNNFRKQSQVGSPKKKKESLRKSRINCQGLIAMDSSGLASLAAVQLYKSFHALHGQHATLL